MRVAVAGGKKPLEGLERECVSVLLKPTAWMGMQRVGMRDVMAKAGGHLRGQGLEVE